MKTQMLFKGHFCFAIISVVTVYYCCCLQGNHAMTTTVDYCVMMGCNNSFIACNDTNGTTAGIICNCTEGFTGYFCNIDVIEEIYNNVTMFTHKSIDNITERSHQTILALADHVRFGYSLLDRSIRYVSRIQEELLVQASDIMDAGTDLNDFKDGKYLYSFIFVIAHFYNHYSDIADCHYYFDKAHYCYYFDKIY
ncbi:uncharacterized protein [Argopecten irradians]|uniref:uncharacterized protein n=1 Tax=Argopecten irradians TaxID=31199 RepID=UPI00371E7992